MAPVWKAGGHTPSRTPGTHAPGGEEGGEAAGDGAASAGDEDRHGSFLFLDSG